MLIVKANDPGLFEQAAQHPCVFEPAVPERPLATVMVTERRESGYRFTEAPQDPAVPVRLQEVDRHIVAGQTGEVGPLLEAERNRPVNQFQWDYIGGVEIRKVEDTDLAAELPRIQRHTFVRDVQPLRLQKPRIPRDRC
jgi:hypothetical protein